MAVVSPPAIITLTIRDKILQSKTENWLTDLKSKIKKYTACKEVHLKDTAWTERMGKGISSK